MNPPNIPFHRPSVTDAEVAAVTAVLRSGWLTTGAKARELEAAIAGYVGAPAAAGDVESAAPSPPGGYHAVALSSCTAALHLALLALGLKEGDEVVTTPYTFVSTGETILYTGARPVFADVERATKNIDPAAVERAVTKKTRAIVTVSMAGHPCRAAEIEQIARTHGIPVVEDAAHSLTARIWSAPVGTQADITCFSFYATKVVTAGEGGMVVTAREDWADRVRSLSLHGLSSAAWSRYGKGGWWEYDVTELGWKYNLTDLQAALGLAQFARAEAMRDRRESIAARYTEGLAGAPGVTTPVTRPGMRHAWHLYQIDVSTAAGARLDRNGLAMALREDGIGTSVHFKPLHLFPWYQERLGVKTGQFPEAEAVFAGTLSLPIWPDMSEADVSRVIERVRFHLERK
ncbi:MAG TPA: DegT/DnrJ/EryC1/StrS aminotransferase family protein [Candidatus Eisenbacteria bacterium]|nr:DegT/DnrJ/EryC1/StrS aminotransferase family protein [Candidatus Eisenbacteria bacterium]